MPSACSHLSPLFLLCPYILDRLCFSFSLPHCLQSLPYLVSIHKHQRHLNYQMLMIITRCWLWHTSARLSRHIWKVCDYSNYRWPRYYSLWAPMCAFSWDSVPLQTHQEPSSIFKYDGQDLVLLLSRRMSVHKLAPSCCTSGVCHTQPFMFPSIWSLPSFLQCLSRLSSCMDASIAIKPVFERFQSVIITSGKCVSLNGF